jgi:hypothetical protein
MTYSLSLDILVALVGGFNMIDPEKHFCTGLSKAAAYRKTYLSA